MNSKSVASGNTLIVLYSIQEVMNMDMKSATIVIALVMFALPAVASAATVSVGDATTVGSTVTVPINVAGALDIGAMAITLTYDSSVLSATGVSKGTVTSDALLITEGTIDASGGISDTDNETMWNYGAIIGDITDNRVNISMISTDGFSGDGTLAEITFTKIATGTCLLTLSDVTANETATCDPCTNEMVVDPESYPAISITCEDGEYVSKIGAADINGNSKVDLDDLILLGVAWGTSTGETGYSAAADINSNGVIDIDDLILLGANWTG